MRRHRPEQVLHQQVARLLDTILSDSWWTTIGHGRPGRLQSAIQKGMGVKPGVPDIMILDAGRVIFIELKAKGGQLSEAQKACHPLMRQAGAAVYVARSLEDVVSALDDARVPHRMSSIV